MKNNIHRNDSDISKHSRVTIKRSILFDGFGMKPETGETRREDH